MAAGNAATFGVVVGDQVEDLVKSEKGMTVVYCDISAACQLSEDALSGKRVKHAMRKLTYLRELREEGKVGLKFVPGEHNMADIFTKPLAGERHAMLARQLLDFKMEAADRDPEPKPPVSGGMAHDATVLGWVTRIDRDGREHHEAMVNPDLLFGP